MKKLLPRFTLIPPRSASTQLRDRSSHITGMRSGHFALPVILLVQLALCSSVPTGHAASNYPTKPIRFIMPFPGGATDFLGRTVGQKLAESLGQSVIVDNRPGAGGNLGIELAAKSPPDGYTLVLVAPSIAISPSLYRNLAYDANRDFVAIAPVAKVTMIIVARPDFPALTLKEFISLAKLKPGQLNYGSGGTGTSLHLAGELFKLRSSIDITHVPYKGASVAMNDVIGGRLDTLFIGIPAPAPHIKTGRLKGLAVLSTQRSAVLPDVPTALESGINGVDVATWYGILGPAGIPKPIVWRLNQELTRIMSSPYIQEQFNLVAAETIRGTSHEFSQYIREETRRWRDVISSAGLAVE